MSEKNIVTTVDWELILAKVEGVVMRKSTWSPTEKDFWDNPKYSKYVGIELDSFVLMDKEKKEHKVFGLKWEIPLNFGDFWVIETKFFRKK